jgi:hypothetical protein
MTRQVLLVCGALLAIAGSAFWIYRTEFAGPEINLKLHQSVGQVMAEETARLAGHGGKVLIITASVPEAPELKVQVEAFEKQLKTLGGPTVQERILLDTADNPKYRPGSGLSAKHFLKIARKHPSADTIVSFVGAPQVSDADLQQLKVLPKLVAETHSPEKLVNLFKKKVLLAAVVPRFEFPAPGPKKPQTGRQWFERYFQVLAPDSTLPVEEATP